MKFKYKDKLMQHNFIKNIIKFFRRPKLLVHLHLYYFNQIDYFIEKLSNISDCDWDLFVTVINKNNEINNKILEFKPDANIIEVSNNGYDIYPFIKVLRLVDLKNYDYILKLHSKGEHKIDNQLHGFCWRDFLVNTLIGSNKQFKKCLDLFKINPAVGMIGTDKSYFHMYTDAPEDNYLYDEVCAKMNIKPCRGNYIGGTMFICRAQLMQKIKDLSSIFNESDFASEMKTGSSGTYAHVFERLFCNFIELQGYIIEIINTETKVSFLKYFLKAIFSIENSRNKKHKIFTLLGIKVKTRRKINAV